MTTTLWRALLLLLLCWRVGCVSIVNSTQQVRSSSFFGVLDVTYADFRVDFDGDLYQADPTPCAPGFCRAEQLLDACFPGCDFASTGADCGLPVNRSAPAACWQQCAELAQTWCSPNYEWTPLGVGEERLFTGLSNQASVFVRFLWTEPCAAFKFDIISTSNRPVVSGSPRTLVPDFALNNCFQTNPACPYAFVCPSSECYSYGTWTIKLECYDTSCDAAIVVRARSLPAPQSLPAAQPPADAPPSAPLPAPYPHAYLPFGVATEVVLPPGQLFALYGFVTPHCGLISVSAEIADYAPEQWAGVTLGVSFDPANPLPLTSRDMLFIDSGARPMWICPEPGADPPLVPVFLGLARYALAPTAFPYPLRVLLYADTPRPSVAPWPRYRLGQTPSERSADTSVYSRYFSFPATNQFWSAGLAANTFRLDCDDAASFTCVTGASLFGSCTELVMSFPQAPAPRALLPLPASLARLDTTVFGSLSYGSAANASLASRTLGAALLLDVQANSLLQLQPLGADWASRLASCRLVTGNGAPFVDAAGGWLHATLRFDNGTTAPECEAAAFAATSQTIDALADQIVVQPQLSSTWRYLADLLTFDEPWQGCRAFVEQGLMRALPGNLSIVLSTKCLNADAADPCCSPSAAWTQCCLPRNFSYDASQLPAEAAPLRTAERCAQAGCVDPLLAEYGRFSFYAAVGECDTPNILQEVSARTASLYRRCFERHFGDELSGRRCFVDADCATASSATCDHVAHRCVDTLSDAQQRFFDCLVDELPPSVRIALLDQLGYAPATSLVSAATYLSGVYTTRAFCTNVAYGGPFGVGRENIKPYSSQPFCPVTWAVDVIEGADRARRTPFWADIHDGDALCSFIGDYTASRTEAACRATGATCNWNASLSDQPAACESGVGARSGTATAFCALCESDVNCAPVDGVDTAAACQQLPPVCLLANGTLLAAGLSADACAATGSCSLPCPGCTQQQCEQQAGVCLDSESIYAGIALSPYTFGLAASGYCIFPMAPFNQPSCDAVKLLSLPTSFGCVAHLDCSIAPGQLQPECTPAYLTPTDCAAAGGRWRAYELTRQACEDEQRCQESIPGVQSFSRSGSSLLTSKSPVECAACGGVSRPVNVWLPGRWLGGDLRQPTWRTRNVTRQQDVVVTVDFVALTEDLNTAALTSISSQLLNNLQCTFQATKGLIEVAVCDCQAPAPAAQLRCFPAQRRRPLGRIRICPATDETFFAQPAKIQVSAASLDASAGADRCLSMQLYRLPAAQFAPQPQPRLSPGFLRRPPFPGTDSYESVVSDGGAIVGQVLGDAIEFVFADAADAQALRQLGLCTALSNNIVQQTARFPLLAFGYVDAQQVVRPFAAGLAVELRPGSNERLLCATLALAQQRVDLHATLVPVALQSNWNTADYATLTSGELALTYVVATLYAVVAGAVLAHIVRLLVLRLFSLTQATNTIWLAFFAMCLIRAIYLYLVAADVLGQEQKHQLVDFWMIDLPLILYMIGNLAIGLSFLFLFLRRIESKPRKPAQFWLLFAAGCAVLVSLFVAVLIAFNYRVVAIPQVEGSLLCPVINDTAATARTIRIIYVALLLFFGICIAATELLMSVGVFRQLAANSVTAWTPFMFAIVSSLGVLADDVAFLVYYIVDQPTTYFLIVTIFTEILPITIVLFVLGKSQAAKKPQ